MLIYALAWYVKTAAGVRKTEAAGAKTAMSALNAKLKISVTLLLAVSLVSVTLTLVLVFVKMGTMVNYAYLTTLALKLNV